MRGLQLRTGQPFGTATGDGPRAKRMAKRQARMRTKKWKEEVPTPRGPPPPLFQCRWKPESGSWKIF